MLLRRSCWLLVAGAFATAIPLAAAILASAAQAQPGAAPAGRPNFLLILSDDQRHDTMDYMPRTKARIFGEGVSFPNAYITTPLCCPSRSSILTGMYAHKHGVRLNPIPLQKETFIQHLKKVGYFTGQVGKYLNSWDGSARPEFDFWAAGPAGTARYFNPRMNIDGVWSEQHGYLTHILRDYALDFQRRAGAQDRPFVLLFSPNAPHFGYPPVSRQPEGPLDLDFFLRPPEPAPGDERLYQNLPPHRPPSYDRRDASGKPRWLGTFPPLSPELTARVRRLPPQAAAEPCRPRPGGRQPARGARCRAQARRHRRGVSVRQRTFLGRARHSLWQELGVRGGEPGAIRSALPAARRAPAR